MKFLIFVFCLIPLSSYAMRVNLKIKESEQVKVSRIEAQYDCGPAQGLTFYPKRSGSNALFKLNVPDKHSVRYFCKDGELNRIDIVLTHSRDGKTTENKILFFKNARNPNIPLALPHHDILCKKEEYQVSWPYNSSVFLASCGDPSQAIYESKFSAAFGPIFPVKTMNLAFAQTNHNSTEQDNLAETIELNGVTVLFYKNRWGAVAANSPIVFKGLKELEGSKIVSRGFIGEWNPATIMYLVIYVNGTTTEGKFGPVDYRTEREAASCIGHAYFLRVEDKTYCLK